MITHTQLISIGSAILTLILPACGVESQSRDPQTGGPANEIGSWPEGSNAEASHLYLAGLDSLLVTRAFALRDSTLVVRVLETVHWWPMTASTGVLPISLGPVSPYLERVGASRGLKLRLVTWRNATTESGDLTPGAPLIILGPLDYSGQREARFRATIYQGANAQTLYRVVVELTEGKWRARRPIVEWQR